MKRGSIRSKLFFWVLALFVLFLSFYAVQSYLAARIVRGRTIESTVSSVEQTNRYLSFLFRKARDIAFVLSTSVDVVDLANFHLREDARVYDEVVLVDALAREMMFQAEVNSEISTIYLYIHEKRQMMTSNPDFYAGGYFPHFAWVEVARTVDEAYRWVGPFRDDGLSERNYISIVCRADILSREVKPATYISVNFDEAMIYRVLEGLRIEETGQVYLTDHEGRIVCAENKELLGVPLRDAVGLDPSRLASSAEAVRVRLDGCHLAFFEPSFVEGWGIVVLFDEAKLLREQRVLLLGMLIGVAVVSIGLFLYASRLVMRNISTPVATLVGVMEQAEKGRFDAEIQEHRDDEFGYLYRSFNRMVQRLDQLIHELYQEKLLKQEIELKSLQNQMNPHFLYNTLDTINWIAKEHRAVDISNIVIALSQLYRSVFNEGRDFIRVRDVLEQARCYLYIECFRYNNLEDYTISADPEVMDWLVLNLIVQPLVENAVVHGIGEQESAGHVNLTVRAEPPLVVFRVEDDGCGMSEAKLGLIRAAMNAEASSTASGLRNVNRRVQLYYGPEYGIRIESAPGGGTTVELAVPDCAAPNGDASRPSSTGTDRGQVNT